MRLSLRLLLALLIAGLVACAQLQPRPALPIEAAVPPEVETQLDELIAAVEGRHPGQSAFRLLSEGPEAFVIRARSAQVAARSLDVQTYIWHADLTGMYLAQQLLEAADRGVKVRLLVDDMDARAKNAGFAALDAHQNITVRLFNPFASREGTLSMLGEGLMSFGRINHRMHNKSWIADNRIAVVGGRNLGDEYFSASKEVNFVDLDFAMIGPVVRDASTSFDRYWNSPAAYPIEILDREGVTAEALATLRTRLAESIRGAGSSRYADVLRGDDAVKRLVDGDWPMEWSANYFFASDDPLKATMNERDPQRSRVMVALTPALRATQVDLAVISPYFVPGERGTAGLVEAAQAGKRVRILTNSLVANDVAAVHGGYSRHREALLEGGVQLWELKPLTGSDPQSSFLGSSGASLHTKALVMDGRTLFVGSYNLDPRSTWLNCEQGVLVENAVLAQQLEAIFATQVTGQRAWQVTLDNKKLHWSDGTETFDSDPKATAGRRFQAWITRVLHLDAQL
ncbi:MAG TPA: phospholipase D family protein [Steroidobacteraceae bacterium]